MYWFLAFPTLEEALDSFFCPITQEIMKVWLVLLTQVFFSRFLFECAIFIFRFLKMHFSLSKVHCLEEPVMLTSGHSFEKEAIEQWIATGRRTWCATCFTRWVADKWLFFIFKTWIIWLWFSVSPKTNERLLSTNYRVNHRQQEILSWGKPLP